MPASQKRIDGGRIPGAVEIPDCIEIVIFWTLANGRIGHTLLHGRSTGSFVPSATTAENIRASFGAQWAPNLALYSPSTTNFFQASVRDLTLKTTPAFLSTNAVTPGTSASPALPPQTALVLSSRTAQRGRGMNGRAYMPNWASNADAGNGQGIPALTAAMNAFGTGLINNTFLGQGLQAVVAHPHRQAYTGLAGAQHAERMASRVDVTNMVLRDLVWDTIRARVKP